MTEFGHMSLRNGESAGAVEDRVADMTIGARKKMIENKKAHLNKKQEATKIHSKSECQGFRDWEQLGVSQLLIKELSSNGFDSPSEVQKLSIPPALSGKDILVKACNGAGKTGSFIVPILNKIDPSRGLQAVIIVHIRELALQISKIIMTLGNTLGIRCMPAVGGTNLAKDIMRLSSGMHIIVGTPGRIDDLLTKQLCKIEENLTLVFDEADKILDSIFYTSINSILNKLPVKRQVMLYSATFPRSIEGFVSTNMKNPLKIRADGQSMKNVAQFFTIVSDENKLSCLKLLLTSLNIEQCIIFCNSKKCVNLLARQVTKIGMSAYFIHSNVDTNERDVIYHSFATKKCKILVSTDVTTRGLDVPGVNVVINFDLPGSSESYQHRVGRAGRFGKKACAVNFINKEERSLLTQFAGSFGSQVLPISDPLFRAYTRNDN